MKSYQFVLLIIIIAILILNTVGCDDSGIITPNPFSGIKIIDLPVFDPDSLYSHPGEFKIPQEYKLTQIGWLGELREQIVVLFELIKASKVEILISKKLFDGTMVAGNQIIYWNGGEFSGKEIPVCMLVNEMLPAGHFSITWNLNDSKGEKIGNGIYGVTMKADGFEQSIWFRII